MLYYNWLGIEKNHEMAKYWCKKALENGNALAKKNFYQHYKVYVLDNTIFYAIIVFNYYRIIEKVYKT